MQITKSGRDTFRNRAGSMSFAPLNVYRHGGKHHDGEPEKSRSQIMNFRRLRSFMRTGNRKNRAKGGGVTMIAVFMLFIFILALVLALMGVPLRGNLW